MKPNGHSTPRWLPWLASAVLSVGIFAYLLSLIDPAEILRTARRLPPGPLALYAILVLGGVLARALRFWILLGRQVGLGLLAGIVLARNLFVDRLPARVGELSYVYLLSRTGHRRAEEGLATLVLSILFDVVAIMTALGTSGSLQFFRVFLGTVAAELAAALPIHGIAGFGTFEGAWALAFIQLGFTREHAIVTGILAHALSQLFEYSMGACALLWLMRPVKNSRQ